MTQPTSDDQKTAVTMPRGTEWAATGQVTLPVPDEEKDY